MTTAQPGQEQRMEVAPCPKCHFEWSAEATPEEVCHHTAYGRDGGAEFIVHCPRCQHNGELKARPEWAVEAWNRLVRPTADLGELETRLSNFTITNDGNPLPLMQEARDRLILYREALEAITREDGKNSRGFIDWQRCVDRIQGIARAVLSRSGL